ncbi:MAG: hypothetical protein KC656_37885, partial [Myxococcales bacterium]|nr:hypothetical protein [Myxococcales bacterium]
MRLLATSDLHVNHTGNAQAVKDLAAHPDDSSEPAEFTLLAVGDSFTFGVAGIAFPRQLAQLLNAEAGRR